MRSKADKSSVSIANCRFRLPICNLKHCFNAYWSALLDSRDSLRLPPIRCDTPNNTYNTTSSSFCNNIWWMDRWVRVLRPFNSISDISRWWKGERGRLCAMKRRLGSGRISPPAGFEPATPWSKVGSANRSATRMLGDNYNIPDILRFYYCNFGTVIIIFWSSVFF